MRWKRAEKEMVRDEGARTERVQQQQQRQQQTGLRMSLVLLEFARLNAIESGGMCGQVLGGMAPRRTRAARTAERLWVIQ